jgi:hypothetical protein
VTGERPSGPRGWMLAGALLTVVGLGIAAISPIAGRAGSDRTGAQQLCGGLIVVVGWVVLAWGIHRFGRESGD